MWCMVLMLLPGVLWMENLEGPVLVAIIPAEHLEDPVFAFLLEDEFFKVQPC